jgi:hypothetical protein
LVEHDGTDPAARAAGTEEDAMAETNRCGAGLEYENLRPFVRDVAFPASRDEIIRQAEQKGAGTDILSYLRSLPEREYGRIEDLSQACKQPEAR